MEFIDIKAIHARSAEAIRQRMDAVIEHGRFINGPEVRELEDALGSYLGGLRCTAVASGTMALEIALRALGIGPGDEVITTPFTWISTAETIGLVGATPVFADIEPATYNIDPQAVEAAISPKTRAIIAVNLFGQMADYTQLRAIAEAHKLFLIEDAAQSLGAEQTGLKSGTAGSVACSSFFPAKPLGCYGDGGAVFTADEALAARIRAITNHGGMQREHHTLLGTNGRCDTLQAAILLAKLPAFFEEIERRRSIGARYSEGLSGVCGTPAIAEGNTHIYAQYTIRSQNREGLAAYLKDRGIPSAVYYRKCLHQQPVFSPLPSARLALPHAEAASAEVISLPFHPYLDESDQDRVISAVIEYASR
jgi:UDP-2-acetamido-2-deoxy-ribo-hexuluronate aminotransferase